MPRTSPYVGLAFLLSVLLHATLTNAALTPMRIGGHGNSIMHALRSRTALSRLGALANKKSTAFPIANMSVLGETQRSAEVENLSSPLKHANSSESIEDRANATTVVPRRALSEGEVVYVYKEVCGGCTVESSGAYENPCAVFEDSSPTGGFSRWALEYQYSKEHTECLYGLGPYGTDGTYGITQNGTAKCSVLNELGTARNFNWDRDSAVSEHEVCPATSVAPKPGSGGNNDLDFTVRSVCWNECDDNDDIVLSCEDRIVWSELDREDTSAMAAFMLYTNSYEVADMQWNVPGSGSKECAYLDNGTPAFLTTIDVSFRIRGTTTVTSSTDYSSPTMPSDDKPNAAAEGSRTERRVAGALTVAVVGALSFVFAAMY